MSSSTKKIILKSSDGETFEIHETVAMESETIKNMIIDNDSTEIVIPMHNVRSQILSMVIDYCKKHVDGAAAAELKTFDKEFVNVDQPTLFDLIQAANYMAIKSLLDLTCMTVADMIKGKTPEEIRKYFKISNTFTPEDEEAIRRENAWAFE